LSTLFLGSLFELRCLSRQFICNQPLSVSYVVRPYCLPIWSALHGKRNTVCTCCH